MRVTSFRVLSLHALLFFSFLLFSLSSVPVILLFPLTAPYYLWGFVLLALVVPLSWRMYGGCPFTIWEKKLRAHESKPIYTKPCIDHYTEEWTGIRLRPKLSTYLLLGLLVLPIFSALVL